MIIRSALLSNVSALNLGLALEERGSKYLTSVTSEAEKLLEIPEKSFLMVLDG